MKVLEDTYAYGMTLYEARRFTEEEKKGYAEWFQEKGLVPTADGIRLQHIGKFEDPLVDKIRKRGYIGMFRGCSNQAYEITNEEWDELLEHDRQAAKDKQIRELERTIDGYHYTIERCEAAPKLYTKEEAREKAIAYNNICNEGGEGYVPHFYTQDEYEFAKKGLQKSLQALEELRKEM